MATAPTLLSIDEYLHTSYKPDVDFVDGEIQERNLGEFDHARMQILLGSFFVSKEKLWGIKGVVEQRIRVSPTRVRICDLAILRADAPRERVTETPPLLCMKSCLPKTGSRGHRSYFRIIAPWASSISGSSTRCAAPRTRSTLPACTTPIQPGSLFRPHRSRLI